jgi:hypothetical protein
VIPDSIVALQNRLKKSLLQEDIVVVPYAIPKNHSATK